MSAHTHDSPSSTQNIVGIHYRVGKKIGEGSFGVIFEGPSPHPQLPESYLTWHFILGINLLNSQSVAIKFVSDVPLLLLRRSSIPH
jgi:casein kinase 1